MPISSAIGVLLAFAAQAEAPAAAPKICGEKFDDWVAISSPGRYSTAVTRNEAEQDFYIICDNSRCRAGFLLLTSCSENFVYRAHVEATSKSFDDELECSISPAGNYQLLSDKDEPYRKAIGHGGQFTLTVPLENGETQTARFSLKGSTVAMAWTDREFERYKPAPGQPVFFVPAPPLLVRRAEEFDDWRAELTFRNTKAFTRNDTKETLTLLCTGSGCFPELNLSSPCLAGGIYPVRAETTSESFDDYLSCDYANGEYFFLPQPRNYAKL